MTKLTDKDIDTIAECIARIVMLKATSECLTDISKNMDILFERLKEKAA